MLCDALAQQLFQLVGASASECDTIPGRQCMASCFFLLKQFEDVLVYLKSIKAYFANDDDFNWNYGILRLRPFISVKTQFRVHRSTFLFLSKHCYYRFATPPEIPANMNLKS